MKIAAEFCLDDDGDPLKAGQAYLFDVRLDPALRNATRIRNEFHDETFPISVWHIRSAVDGDAMVERQSFGDVLITAEITASARTYTVSSTLWAALRRTHGGRDAAIDQDGTQSDSPLVVASLNAVDHMPPDRKALLLLRADEPRPDVAGGLQTARQCYLMFGPMWAGTSRSRCR